MMKSFDHIRTPRTIIRRLRPEDKDKIIELLCDKSVTQNMAFPDDLLNVEGVHSLLQMTINAYDTESPLLSFAITNTNSAEFIGVTGFNPLSEEEIEIFFALLPDHWGRGFATEICKSLTAFVFQNDHYKTIVAPISKNNLASVKVVEKNGFINTGLKNDPNYSDLVYIYKKSKN